MTKVPGDGNELTCEDAVGVDRPGGPPSSGSCPDDGPAWPDDPTPVEQLRVSWRDVRPAWTEESWWDIELRPEVRRLLWLPAGPALAEALAGVPATGACRLAHAGDRDVGLPPPGHTPGWPCACQVVLAAAWQACQGWASAGAWQALVAAAGSEPVDMVVANGSHQLHDPARDELAHALRWSIPSMGRRITSARAVAEHPELVELVRSAAMTPWAGQLVTEHLADLNDEQASAVVAAVATRVRQRLASGRRPYTSAEVNQAARAARLRIAPETEKEARVRAFAGRRVVVHQRPDGMATLIAELSDTDAHRIHRRLTAIAAGLQASAGGSDVEEQRTRDQLRADVLSDLLLGVGDAASNVLPGPGVGVPGAPDPSAEGAAGAGAAAARPYGAAGAEIQVIVTLESLLGVSCEPGLVPGLGPIPAETARQLAADGRWRAWITDAAGAVTATGSTGYVPAAAVARLVRAREPRCRFPGCRQPAVRCDLDHVVPWPQGRTTTSNLGPLCRRHHQLKTHGNWRIDTLDTSASPPGVDSAGWRWRTPAGFTVLDEPEPPLW